MIKDKNKIMNLVSRTLSRNGIIDNSSILEIDSVIDRILNSKEKKINDIKNKAISTTIKKYGDKHIENHNTEVVIEEDAINLAMLIHTVLSEYLADNIDWWIEIALDQYRKIATAEVNKIVDEILTSYSSKRYLTENDVKNATYRSFFKNAPNTRVEVLIPKDNEFIKCLVEMVDEYKNRKDSNK